MKNIMLIAVATLTIATANADWYNWSAVSPVQIVNNTNLPLVFRTEPDNQFFMLNPDTSTFASNVGDTSFYVAWQNGTNPAPIVLTTGFDQQPQQGTMSTTTAVVSANLNLDQAWNLSDVGVNDQLVLTGTANGTTMQLTATRTRGVTVYRGEDEYWFPADVFCLDTGVEFGLASVGDSGRCPASETRVVMANDTEINTFNFVLDNWTAGILFAEINYWCQYNVVGCPANPYGAVDGQSMTGFDTINYSSTNTHITLSVQGK